MTQVRLRRALCALALTVPLFAAGCAGFIASHDLAPDGLTRNEHAWRTLLARERMDTSAMQSFADKRAPDDELLRLLYLGTTAHYAEDYAASNRYLEAAATLADDRVTKSISRAALSLVSNDGVLPWSPSDAERLLIPYYAAQNYIALDDIEGAAVEARRLSALLAAASPPDDDEKQLRATLHAFAGEIFAAKGDRNDAMVAWRNAVALGGHVDTTAVFQANDSIGNLVILVESGFAAHRVEQNLYVWLGADELHAFTTGTSGTDRSETATGVAARVMQAAFANDRPRHTRGDFYVQLPPDRERRHRRTECGSIADAHPDSAAGPIAAASNNRRVERNAPPRERRDCDEDDAPYLLKVAWPVFTQPPALPRATVVAGTDTVHAQFTSVSRALEHDFDAQLPLIVARTVARGAAKAALTESAKRSAARKNDGLGTLVGLLGNAGNVLLERADTRSWHLLPEGVSLVRVRLPAGPQPVSIRTANGTIDLGVRNVGAGHTRFVSHRVF